VRAEWRSIRGPVRVAWQLDARTFELEVSVPPNVRATVVLPAAAGSTATEGGVPVTKAPGVRFLGRKGGTLRLDVGSGTYRFVVRQAKRRA
jgi:alpha-L-rhamnosidase